MSEARIYTIIVAIFIVTALAIGTTTLLSGILTSNDITFSDNEKEINSSIYSLKNNMSIWYEDTEDVQANSTAISGDQGSYNIGIISPILKKIESLKNIILSTINLFKNSLDIIPGWAWYLFSGLISFTLLWKIAEAWIGRES